MQIAVYDCYVVKQDNSQMHFDVLVELATDKKQVLSYVQQYLYSKQIGVQHVKAQRCIFCHVETPAYDVQQQIQVQGYSILEMKNCTQ